MKYVSLFLLNFVFLAAQANATKCEIPKFPEERFSIQSLGKLINENGSSYILDNKNIKIKFLDTKNILEKYIEKKEVNLIAINDRFSIKKDIFEWRYEYFNQPCGTQSVTIYFKDGTSINAPKESLP